MYVSIHHGWYYTAERQNPRKCYPDVDRPLAPARCVRIHNHSASVHGHGRNDEDAGQIRNRNEGPNQLAKQLGSFELSNGVSKVHRKVCYDKQ